MPLSEATGSALRAFRALGLDRQEAFDTTRALLYAEIRGGKSQHGLDRFPWIERNLGTAFVPGRPLRIAEVDAEQGYICLDGDGGWGYSQAYAAVMVAARALENRQLVHVGLVNSYTTNCLGDYAAILATRGHSAYVGSASPSRVAFPGATRPTLGTCGQAFSHPGTPPVVLDFSIGAMTNGQVMHHRRQGLALPDGSCLDAAGRPTIDARDVIDADGTMIGAILPRGGADAGAVVAGMGIIMMAHAAEMGIADGRSGTFILARRALAGSAAAVEAFRDMATGGEAGVELPGAHGRSAADRVLAAGGLELDEAIWQPIADAASRESVVATDDADGEEIRRQLADDDYRPPVAPILDPFAGT